MEEFETLGQTLALQMHQIVQIFGGLWTAFAHIVTNNGELLYFKPGDSRFLEGKY